MSEQDEDFAQLFETSLKVRRLEKGQTVDGMVVSIGPEVALVSVGGKSEAVIEPARARPRERTAVSGRAGREGR